MKPLLEWPIKPILPLALLNHDLYQLMFLDENLVWGAYWANRRLVRQEITSYVERQFGRRS